MTKVGVCAIDKATTLESNKSHSPWDTPAEPRRPGDALQRPLLRRMVGAMLLLRYRGLSSNGAENWDRASSLLDRPLRPPNDHGVFPRIIFCNHLFLRTFMHQQPKTTREVLPYVIPLRRCESTDV